MGHFDITWGYKGQWGDVGYIFMGCYTHGGFSYQIESSSIVYRVGDLYTYYYLHVETPEARSRQRLGLR